MAEDPYGIVGHVLDGQFRVDAPIGEGGFSIVYRGHHIGLDEPIAVKCLKLQGQGPLGSAVVETFLRRFRDESKIHYRLSRGSLHIARALGAGTTMAPFTGALVPYMILEWLDGFTLAAELGARRLRGERGRPLAEVIRLLDPVAEAMAYAHAQGVVHRDLSPSNVFVSHRKDGGVALKVLDFGVAKVVSDHLLELHSRAVTVGQLRMFTPAYGAPEQFEESLGPVSPATDVHAFALMIVELLSDRSPFESNDLRDIANLVLDPVRRPTPRAFGVEVGPAVEDVMGQALRIAPKERPGDIGEFWGMLKNAVQRDRASSPSPPWERGRLPTPAGPASGGAEALYSSPFAPALPKLEPAEALPRLDAPAALSSASASLPPTLPSVQPAAPPHALGDRGTSWARWPVVLVLVAIVLAAAVVVTASALVRAP